MTCGAPRADRCRFFASHLKIRIENVHYLFYKVSDPRTRCAGELSALSIQEAVSAKIHSFRHNPETVASIDMVKSRIGATNLQLWSVQAGRSVWQKILVTACLGVMLALAHFGAGYCQDPGYGRKPYQWAPYASGRYLERLQKIIETYRLADSKIADLHLRKPARKSDLSINSNLSRFGMQHGQRLLSAIFVCLGEIPFMTLCQFEWARLIDLFDPDDTRFVVFEFFCRDAHLQVRIMPGHWMAMSH